MLIVSNFKEVVAVRRKRCNHLYTDWCHHPDRQPQEKCPFYYDNNKCEDYELKERGGGGD